MGLYGISRNLREHGRGASKRGDDANSTRHTTRKGYRKNRISETADKNIHL